MSEEVIRLGDVPSIPATRPDVPRVRLDETRPRPRPPTLDDALRDPALFAFYVAPCAELIEPAIREAGS
jgi:hypothetical protein